jgi:hypothetical protein
MQHALNKWKIHTKILVRKPEGTRPLGRRHGHNGNEILIWILRNFCLRSRTGFIWHMAVLTGGLL